MPVTVVVGAQWGDEGKAKVIDLLAEQHSIVARYQGGHNAGHTVVVEVQRYALQLIPSGVLYPHVTPVIGNGVVVDLPTLFKEMDSLESRGVSCAALKVSRLAHLILPWHQIHDALAEAARGDQPIGTTLKGIGPAYADKARRLGIRAGEVADLETLAVTLRSRAIAEQHLIEQALAAAAATGIVLPELAELDVDQIVEQWLDYGRRLQPHLADTVGMLHEAREAGADILLEGAQATFLDLDHGTYPYVTSSSPTAGGASAGSGLGPRHLDRIIGITKAYTTRVGAGPFPTELIDTLGDRLIDVGHEYGTVTGRRRRAGWLDAYMLRHAVRINSLTEFALTKLDVLDGFDEVCICIGYRIDGKAISHYPDTATELAQVEPVYVTLPGWRSDLTGIRDSGDLPAKAAEFLRVVEQTVDIPVNIVGVGAARDAYLHWTTT